MFETTNQFLNGCLFEFQVFPWIWVVPTKLGQALEDVVGQNPQPENMLFSPKNPVSQIKRKKKKRSFQIPDLSCWKKCHKKKCSQIMSSFAPCSSHSLQIKVTQWQNWEERHLEWQIFIQPRHLAQIDMMMYIHMYRCVYLEIYIYILCTMFVSISICMYRYMYINYILCRYVCIHVCIYIYYTHVCMRGRQIVDYRPNNSKTHDKMTTTNATLWWVIQPGVF